MPDIYEIAKIESGVITLREVNSQDDSVSLDIVSNTGAETVTLYDVDFTIWDFGGPLEKDTLFEGNKLTLFRKTPSPQNG